MPTVPVPINYLAVLVAALAAMVIGAIWYAPPVLGNKWMQLVNLDKDKARTGAALGYFGMLVASLVTAYVLAHSIAFVAVTPYFPNFSPIMQGLMTGLFSWIGFVVPVLVSGPLFAKSSWHLFFITAGHYLVSLLAMGAIIGAWR
ncbi:MAG: DUF1761 domain-containing protein [Candidatus Andersenbacteria bacterium]